MFRSFDGIDWHGRMDDAEERMTKLSVCINRGWAVKRKTKDSSSFFILITLGSFTAVGDTLKFSGLIFIISYPL